MMECQLFQEKESYHFMTRRFDRMEDGEKIHVQTLAGLAHYDRDQRHSYEEIFRIMRQMNLPYPEQEELYRRMMFNVMSRNHDDHSKNFSFLMDRQGKWKLAPAYDLCYSYTPASEQSELYRRMVFNVMGGNVDDHIKNFSFLMERNGTWHITPAYDMTFTTNLDGAAYENVHSMNITGKDNGITEDDLLLFARQNGIKNAKRIIEEVSLAISHFYDYATNHQIDDYWKDRIEEHLSGLVSPTIGETMKHYLPTIVEPYETENGFLVSEINIIENTRHDFRIEAVINGKRQKYIAGRKSDLAVEIIAKGRNKMTVENKKELVERLLLPLAKR